MKGSWGEQQRQAGQQECVTLSMLAWFSLMMEAWASRSYTVRSAFLEYRSWGLNSSSMNFLLNMVLMMSFITAKTKRLCGLLQNSLPGPSQLQGSHWGYLCRARTEHNRRGGTAPLDPALPQSHLGWASWRPPGHKCHLSWRQQPLFSRGNKAGFVALVLLLWLALFTFKKYCL